ncbi:MAG TPA: nickel-binding protein [Chloroflexia bacterium]|jgi:muconolactone delta-isomerase
MAIYIVERFLPGMTQEQVEKIQQSEKNLTQAAESAGGQIRHIRTIYVPGEVHYMSMFEAADPESLRAANEEAELPFTRIIEAAEL